MIIKSNKIVGLSVAHNPKDVGACYGGHCEHTESLVWTAYLEKCLNKLGYQCVTAPIGGLTKKVTYLNCYQVSVCIEIHFNSAGNTNKVTGCETLFCPGSQKGKKFADIVHAEYAPAMMVRDRGVKQGWYKMNPDRGIKDYFLKATYTPSIIAEPDFISNIENIRTQMPQAVEAMAWGIHLYLLGKQ